jgi:diguanylate cyclase
VDEIKVDKSFVMNMLSDENDAVIVRSTIDLGRNLGLRVVAEGVETEEIWGRLAYMGCDLAQGNYLSVPMAPEELVTWLQETTRGLGAQADHPANGSPTEEPAEAPLSESARPATRGQ